MSAFLDISMHNNRLDGYCKVEKTAGI